MTQVPAMSPQAAFRALETHLRSFDVGRVSGEGLCLSLGEGLGRAFDEFQRLTESFRAVEKVFTGNELEALSKAVGQVRETVSGMTGGLDAECEAIDSLVTLGDALGSRFDLVRRSVRTIAALATNSRVEAASVDSRVGEVSGFAQELVNLAAQAQKAIDGCCREQAVLSDILRVSRKTLNDFKNQHSGDLAVVERDLGEVGTLLVDHRSRAGAAAAGLATRTHDIASAIGAIVMALQIGDSTRQRVEHVIDGLSDIPTLYSDEDDVRSASATGCRLARLQLHGAREDLATASARISGSLLKLAGQADDIVTMAGQVSRKDGANESFIGTVRAKLSAAIDLSQQSGNARTNVDAAVAGMTRSTEKLNLQMQDLSDLTIAMTMIGINAILKAKRVGTAGLGLGVIADQLRAAADTVVAEMSEVKPMLGKAVAQTQGLAATLAGRRGDQMDRGSTLVGDALTTFASCDKDIKLAIDTLIQKGSRVARDLEGAAHRPDARDAAEAMDDFAHALQEIAASLSSDETRRADETATEAAFAKRYTMASERTIHASFWSSEGFHAFDQGQAA